MHPVDTQTSYFVRLSKESKYFCIQYTDISVKSSTNNSRLSPPFMKDVPSFLFLAKGVPGNVYSLASPAHPYHHFSLFARFPESFPELSPFVAALQRWLLSADSVLPPFSAAVIFCHAILSSAVITVIPIKYIA